MRKSTLENRVARLERIVSKNAKHQLCEGFDFTDPKQDNWDYYIERAWENDQARIFDAVKKVFNEAGLIEKDSFGSDQFDGWSEAHTFFPDNRPKFTECAFLYTLNGKHYSLIFNVEQPDDYFLKVITNFARDEEVLIYGYKEFIESCVDLIDEYKNKLIESL